MRSDDNNINHFNIKQLLAYLRQQIENETISYSEIAQLQDLKDYIPLDDILLLEWAGVPGFEDDK